MRTFGRIKVASIVIGFYVFMALFSTTAFVNELTSGMVLDSVSTLR